MGKLWAIIKREYLERVRSKWFLISTLFGPVLMAAMLVLPALLARRSLETGSAANVVVLDASGTALGTRIAAALTGPLGDTAAARVRVVAPDELARAESLATQQVMRNEVRGYLVLDRQTLQTSRARYAGRNASSIPDVQRIERSVQQALIAHQLEGTGLPAASIDALTKTRARLATERISDRGRGGSGTVSIAFAFGVAFVLYTMIVLYGQAVLRGVMEEKTTRVAEVVVAGVPPDTLMAGKVLGVGAVAMTQLLGWAAAMVLFYQARGPILGALGLPAVPMAMPDVSAGTALVLLLFFVLGFVLYAALFAAVGSTVNSEQDAQQASTPVLMLVIFAAVFIQPVVLKPESQLSTIVSWIPFSAPILMPVRLSLVAVPWYELAGVIAGMILTCFLAVWVASRVYRVGLLMYGKRPTWGELARWVRASN